MSLHLLGSRTGWVTKTQSWNPKVLAADISDFLSGWTTSPNFELKTASQPKCSKLWKVVWTFAFSVKPCLIWVSDRLHLVGGCQMLWAEAAWAAGGKPRKAGKAWRLVPGYRPRPHETQLPSSVVAGGGWPVVLLPMCEYLLPPFYLFHLHFSSAFPVMLPIKPQSWTESGPKLIVWSGEQLMRKTVELWQGALQPFWGALLLLRLHWSAPDLALPPSPPLNPAYLRWT